MTRLTTFAVQAARTQRGSTRRPIEIRKTCASCRRSSSVRSRSSAATPRSGSSIASSPTAGAVRRHECLGHLSYVLLGRTRLRSPGSQAGVFVSGRTARLRRDRREPHRDAAPRRLVGCRWYVWPFPAQLPPADELNGVSTPIPNETVLTGEWTLAITSGIRGSASTSTIVSETPTCQCCSGDIGGFESARMFRMCSSENQD